ncbi:MAG: hypothetical protein COS39_08150 [Hydrogenophilales bacterium CG03_land_8_20_14_0_80_62_28]|nr:hypothetical protein [Betaproteobacteria bacterium]OIO76899.1 MAG: hypothetical protein AUJ86_10505 [Hydrogenophilaceae bacterium CG1_02_62_390]PIV22239.1 MAG: hypothetical protein COS39_08150 [Hydrogenophilales bacterium CG03_land_8_20_14_0_80_62_28]PIW39721.1 MAG: hypothetical protein COW23_00405 [Hydrogenophilales bacterium CG15_BIG_FIL_POST_REV_8_21_14_020_62_31]PIW72051.1 MAG: hypothetical protein COW07_05035 [Hydrogenophilales bacterium CG12_big_fil_rev_8_21_14_0_65_61_21]PIX02128.1 M
MAGLSYQQGPPLALPLRFFLAAPLFLMLAGVSALAIGQDGLVSRWSPAVLAIVHLLTLGYLGTVMMGALTQMLPVVLGARIPAVRAVAGATLSGLVVGVALLAAGLAFGKPALLVAAMVALALALVTFLTAMAIALLRAGVVVSDTVWPLRQAWLALLSTTVLGLALAGGFAGLFPDLDLTTLTALHVAWGLAGWILILVIGVAYQVVPMLQLTPPYPNQVSRWLTWLVLIGLIGYSAALFWLDGAGIVSVVGRFALAAGAGIFAIVTLVLQHRRRRKLGDATLTFWRLAMASLLGCAAAGPLVAGEPAQMAVGGLFLLGFAASAVNGMLYKIVPFLAWFHLQAQTQARAGTIPSMKAFVPEDSARRHLWLHASAVCLLVPAPFLPWPVASVGWLLLVLSGDRLWRNLLAARRLYLAYGGCL